MCPRWFVLTTMNNLQNVAPPKPIQSTGAKAPGRKKGAAKKLAGKKVLVTPIKKSASFKRGKKRLSLSPLARNLTKKLGKVAKNFADPADMAAIATAHAVAASSGDDASIYAKFQVASETLPQFHARLQKLGIPKQLLPPSIGKGQFSYTVRNPKAGNQSSLQVLHAKGAFYLTKDKNGLPVNTPTVSWAHHTSCEAAWEWTKKILGW